MNGKLVYAHQDLTQSSNDLVILNDGLTYKNTGLTLGKDAKNPNLRISYNTNDSTGHINGTKLSIDTPFVSMPFLSKSSAATISSYLVIDSSGNITTGEQQYTNNINSILNSIQNNLTTIEAQIVELTRDMQDIDPNKLIPSLRFSKLWIYILIGAVAFLLLVCLFFFIQWLRTSYAL